MKRVLGTLALLCLVATTATAQITTDFTGSGARAQGMGHAYIGISDDVSAVSWNPAGLIALDKPMLGLGYNYFMPRGKGQFDNFLDAASDFHPGGSFSSISMVSFIAPIRVRGHQFVSALNYGLIDEDHQFTEVAGKSFVSEFGALYDIDISRQSTSYIAPKAFNAGFGTRLYDKISFGFTVNVFSGRALSDTRRQVTANDIPMPNDPRQTVTALNDLVVTDSIRYGGVNFTVGFKYNSERFTAGLVIKSPYDLNLKSNQTIVTISSFNGLIDNDATDTIYYDNNLTKREFPMVVALGGGYKLKPNWLMAADFEYRAFSGKKILVRDTLKIVGGNTEEVFSEFDPDWDNAFAVRFGSEYTFATGSRLFPTVPVRAGFSYAGSPVPSYNREILTRTDDDVTFRIDPSGASKTAFSLGIGTAWSQVHLDLAWTLWKTSRNYPLLEAPGASRDVPFLPVMFWVENEDTNHAFSLTFTGYF